MKKFELRTVALPSFNIGSGRRHYLIWLHTLAAPLPVAKISLYKDIHTPKNARNLAVVPVPLRPSLETVTSIGSTA